MLGTTQLASSCAEKGLEFVVGTKLTKSQQQSLVQSRQVVSWTALEAVSMG